MAHTSRAFFAAGIFSLIATNVFADDIFFGGKPEKFTGAGDKQPPRCEVTAPTSASDEFFISWNCFDQFDNTPQDKIRSAVWIRRANDTRYYKVDDFLGFPASLFVDRALLQITPDADVKTGLPVSFRIEAMDTAGITTITDIFSVLPKTSSFQTCDLTVSTQATASTGDSVGTPASQVVLAAAPIQLENASGTSLRFSSKSVVTASPCEITSLCDSNSEVSFTVGLDAAADGTASGSVSLSPGNANFSVTGTATATSDLISSVAVTGQATIDGSVADLTLSCGTGENSSVSSIDDGSASSDTTISSEDISSSASSSSAAATSLFTFRKRS